jgi:hypothetical protein
MQCIQSPGNATAQLVACVSVGQAPADGGPVEDDDVVAGPELHAAQRRRRAVVRSTQKARDPLVPGVTGGSSSTAASASGVAPLGT